MRRLFPPLIACGAACMLIAASSKPPIPALKTLKVLPRAVSASVSTPVLVNLSWTYEPGENTDDLIFKIFTTTNIAAATWQNVTNVTGPATNVVMAVVPGVRFYSITVYSKFWDLEVPSAGMAQTPPAPKTAPLQIKKAL